MLSEREALRYSYWNSKYQSPDWTDDIHFALFSSPSISVEAFRRGVALNTIELLHDVFERASVYRLSAGPRILDYGCGAGDFLIALGEALPGMVGMGFDIADSAVEKAQARLNSSSAKGRVSFRVGGLVALEEEANNGVYDIIVCRDMFYLLDPSEQQRLFSVFRRALAPGGLACVADLAVKRSHVVAVQKFLIERQFGGEAITWEWEGTKRRFSIEAQAAEFGLELACPVKQDEHAVEYSYAAAASLAGSSSIQDVFLSLSAAARPSVGQTWSQMPYIRCFFSVATDCAAAYSPKESVGI